MLRLARWSLIVVMLCGFAGAADAGLSSFDVVAENSYLTLYFDPTTTQIAVKQRSEGFVWFSNPQDLAARETTARGTAREQLESQFVLFFFTPGDRQLSVNTHTHSVIGQQFQTEPIENGVRVQYHLGERWRDAQYLPVVASRAFFETEILASGLDEDAQELFRSSFHLFSFRDLEEDERRERVSGVDLEALFGSRTLHAEGESNTIRERGNHAQLLFQRILSRRTDRDHRSDLRPDDLAPFVGQEFFILDNELWSWDIDAMVESLKQIGYEPDRHSADFARFGLEPPRENLMVFSLTVEYRLEGRDLVVEVPLDQISYPLNVENERGQLVTYPLTNIRVLPFFGAGSTADTGYLFVPDGSGALIHFNNGKTSMASYVGRIYGRDPALAEQYERSRRTERIYLPVYGIRNNDQAFLAIIESGAPLGRIHADVAGRVTSYNVVYPDFNIIPFGQTGLRAQRPEPINIYQPRISSGDLVVRYRFLPETAADYVGMASAYREYLQNQGVQANTDSEVLPFYLELIGAIDDRRPVFGLPRSVVLPLTTFAQAESIVAQLTDQGVSGLELQFSGWLSGGLRHHYPSKASVLSSLGGPKGLMSFAAQLSGQGIGFYPEVSFLQVEKTRLLDGFIAWRDASRFLDGRLARVFQFDRATYGQVSGLSSYLLSPAKLMPLVARFSQSYAAIGLAGLSLRHVTYELHGDYHRGQHSLVDRVQSLGISLETLTYLDASYSLLAARSADYALPYLQHLTSIPVVSSRHGIFDQDVPFYALALRGLVPYGVGPLNLADDYEQSRLKLFELGAAPGFTMFYQPGSAVKDTDFAYLHSCHAAGWLDEASALYQEANAVLGPLKDYSIIGHAQLESGLMQSTFADGTRIVVNYNYYQVEAFGQAIAPLSYLVVREGSE